MTQQKFEKRRKRRKIAKDKGRNNDSNSRMKKKLENKNPQGQVNGRHNKDGSYKRFKTRFNYSSSGSGQNSVIPVVSNVPE